MSNFNSTIEDGIFESMDIPFAQVSKYALGDLSMSNKAKGLYAIIAMHITTPNSIPLRKKALMDMSTDGTRAFNSEWTELKEKGYLKQMRIRVEKGFTYKYRLCIKPDLETPATVNVRMDGTIVDNTYEGQETFDNILPDKPCLDIEVEDEYEIKSQINYSKLKNEPFIDEIVDVILEVNESDEIITSVNGEQLPTHKLKAAFNKLDSHIIKEVIERLKIYNKPIINIKSFLITVLYNAIPYEHSTGTDPP